MPATNVAKSDTLEILRQKVNTIASDIFDFTSGQTSIPVFKTEYSDGSLSSPSLTFSSDNTLGIYKEGVRKLGFASDGKPILSLSNTGSYFTQNFYGEKRSVTTAGLTTTNPGSGYEPGSYTNIDLIGGKGTGAKANITVANDGTISNVSILEGGYGYLVNDILTVDPPDISESPTGRVVSLTPVTAGKTYVSGNNVATTGGSGNGLTVDITASVNGVTSQIGFLNGTEGYVSGTNVSTTGGTGTGLTIDIVAATGGIIGTFNNVNSGSDYFAGTYSPTGGAGSGASVYVDVTGAGAINTISSTAAGTGYVTGEQPSTGGSGSGASFNIVASPLGTVSGVQIGYAGSGYTEGVYTNQPVNSASPGTGLTVDYSVDSNGSIINVVVNNSGSGYTVGETFSVNGSSTDDPASFDIISVNPGGSITSITLANSGLGYLVNDVLTISNGSNGTVTVTDTIGGQISSISIINGGQNYQVGDVLTIPSGTGGTFTVSGVTGGAVSSAAINTPGSGYSINDVVTIGSGTATVVITEISGGSITGLTINSQGTGYTIGDVITISGVNNAPDKATYSVTTTTDGSGLALTATTLSVTNPIKANLLTGDVEALSFTSLLGEIDDLTCLDISTSTLLASTSLSTPQINSTNNLNLSVTNDTTFATSRINVQPFGSGTVKLSIESSNGNLTTDGQLKALNGLNVNDITTIVNNEISTLLGNPLIITPASGEVVKIDSNRALILPVGSQIQRPQLDAETGAIRFNTDTRQFEGYDSNTNVWSSLGSVRDTDGNTYLLAEASVGANDNIFYFYNNNTNTLRITENQFIFQGMDTVSSVSGEVVFSNTDLTFDNNLTLSTNKIESKLSGLTIKPSTGTNVIIDSQSSLVIPAGSTAERGSASTGSIRFNTSNYQFEGYGLNAWSSLGGVRDVDGNTYIIPELSAGSNENILYFANNGFDTLQLHQDKLEFRNANIISSIDLTGVVLWQPATLYQANDLIYNGTNVYRVTINLTSGGSGTAPVHTSGTTNNYQYIRNIYGDLSFTNVNNFNVNSTLNVNNKLKIINSDISSVTEDITITPFTGKLVKVNSTTSLVLPVGNSSNRGIAEAGAVRFNTATTQYEGYNGSAWTSLGGVRDVDGNTYIIPESSSGANENILYFYNDGDNTLRVTKTSLTFQTANTITSNNDILNINVNDVRYSSDTFGINSSSATITKLYSGKNNLDIGLKSGLTNDALLRLSATGDIYVNTTFTEGSYTGTKVLDRSLTYFGLANAVLETNKFTLVKGTNNFNSYVLYDPTVASACKVTIVAVDLSTFEKHMVDYNIIANGANIYNIEYESLLSGNLLYDATFDFDSNGDVRLTATLDNSVSNGSSIEFTILKTFIR